MTAHEDEKEQEEEEEEDEESAAIRCGLRRVASGECGRIRERKLPVRARISTLRPSHTK